MTDAQAGLLLAELRQVQKVVYDSERRILASPAAQTNLGSLRALTLIACQLNDLVYHFTGKAARTGRIIEGGEAAVPAAAHAACEWGHGDDVGMG